MGATKLQSMKAISTLAYQPTKMTQRYRVIAMLDLCGTNGKDIATSVGMTPERVSMIRNSPIYKEQLKIMQKELFDRFADKKAEALVTGDLVRSRIKEECLKSVERIVEIRDSGEARLGDVLAASRDILDRGGYKLRDDKSVTTVEITEKMANRFERALGYGTDQDAGTASIRVTQKVST